MSACKPPAAVTVIEADVIEALRRFPDDHFIGVITDPPYGLSTPPPAADVLRQWLDTGEYHWPHKGGGFMGAEWDRFVPGPALWREVYRVLRPGGIVLCFAGARTDHWMAVAAEIAGFQKIDGIPWIHGQGFPKAGDMGKLIDRQRHDRETLLGCTRWIHERCKALGLSAADLDRACGTAGMGGHWTSAASQHYVPTREQWAKLEPLLGPMPPEMDAQGLIIDAREPGEAFKRREVVTVRRGAAREGDVATDFGKGGGEVIDTLPATDDAARWTGWAALLKPANEPVIVMRKPPRGTLVANVLEYGCGALHIDACRVGTDSTQRSNKADIGYAGGCLAAGQGYTTGGNAGRWPPNVLFTHSPDCDESSCVEHCPVVMLDAQSGERRSGARVAGAYGQRGDDARVYGVSGAPREQPPIESSIGGASRFFWAGRHAQPEDRDGFKYSAKARRGSDRDAGLPADIVNRHPTVKPQAVAEWCARLIGSDAGPILVPFAGSGTEARACVKLGFEVVAIERDPEYAELTRLRCGLPETETAACIRLRDRLRDAAVPRPRKKGPPMRPETPGVPLVKSWSPAERAACAEWLAQTGGDARVAPPPPHMAEWTPAYTPPPGHPVASPAAPQDADESDAAELVGESVVEQEQAAATAGPSTLITEPPAGGRPRRKRKAPAGFAAAADAATLDGDPLSSDGATLRSDGPGRLAEVIAAAAFGVSPAPTDDPEIAAARARGEAALRRLPPMVSVAEDSANVAGVKPSASIPDAPVEVDPWDDLPSMFARL